MNDIISLINKKIREYNFLEFYIYSFSNRKLVLVGSDDLLYYHDFEIVFLNTHTVLCNAEFIVNTSEEVFYEVTDTDETKEINIKFEIVQGNRIFKIISQDGASFYIAAENIELFDKAVKY